MILDSQERYMCEWIPAPEHNRSAGATWWVDAFDNIDALYRTIRDHRIWRGTFPMLKGDVIEIHKYLEGTTESRRIFKAVKGDGVKWLVEEDGQVCTAGHPPCHYAYGQLASYPVCSTFKFDDYDQWTKRQYKDKYPHPSSDKKPNFEANNGKESQNKQDAADGTVV